MSRHKDEHKKPGPLKHITHSPHHQTKTSKHLKRIIILAVVVLIACVAAVGILLAKNDNKKASKQDITEAVDLLGSEIMASQQAVIVSKLGFKISYDATSLYARGQTTDPKSDDNYVFGVDYDGKELEQAREYSIVKFRAKSADPNVPSKFLQPEMSLITNIREAYWSNRESKPEHKGRSKIDILVNEDKTSQAKNGYAASDVKDLTINNVAYKHIVYTDSSKAYGFSSTLEMHTYLTVQNDRPYTIRIYNINPANRVNIVVYEAALASIVYENLDASLLSNNNDNGSGHVAAATDEKLPEGTSNTPYSINPDTLFKTILKNQPATVRVGAAGCYDVELMMPDGSVGLKIDNACGAGVGSGSIVSADGYIATNGHVTTVTANQAISIHPFMTDVAKDQGARVGDLLKYLYKSKVVTADMIDSLIKGLNANDPKALSIATSLGEYVPADRIKVKAERKKFAIQLAKEPIKYDLKTGEFSYAKTVISAKYIDMNFDPSANARGKYTGSTSSDVALLKADGKFPVIQMGSISSIKTGDELTAIGFPAFVDGGLIPTKSETPPTVTQGKIIQIDTESPSSKYQLVVTTVPIAQGNSGGPAFNVLGEQIGLNTYGKIDCPDMKCFGSGTARDIADFKALVSKNSITLNTKSGISETWEKALTDYQAGNYKSAVKGFQKVSSDYPAHYLAPKLEQLAVSKYGSATDISGSEEKKALFMRLGVGLGAVVLLAGGFLVIHLVRGSRKHGIVQAAGKPYNSNPQPMTQQYQQPPVTPQPQVPAMPQPSQPQQVPNIQQPPQPQVPPAQNIVQPQVIQPTQPPDQQNKV